ncbi:MAG: UDP-N-acetylglucosamine pyrophosphorylase [Clostridiales bacterium]|jgi:NDP-sugar pyrophosphorylase family protein|nr:UDP-N-acetylglucosamine pyrophosphorylase [Clostridiales bacterium]OPZ67765.1 MAG: Bifunctional protein GlmU [Firmicutes bacterium ADurb.Bin467]
MRELLRADRLFDLGKSIAAGIFEGKGYPWEVLPEIGDYVKALGETLCEDEYERVDRDVWIARDATVAPSALIAGPTIIDHGAEIRHCAFIRGKAVIGKECVVGNSVEVKNAILFDGAQVPHFNYVGDSVLGHRAHMGAGAVTSNVKSDKSMVTVKTDDRRIATNLRKFGAMLGDFAEVGCNSVLCPGAIVGRWTTIYPTCCVRGFVPEHSVYKDFDNVVPKWGEDTNDRK